MPYPTLSRELVAGPEIDWDAERATVDKRNRTAAAPLEALAALRFAATSSPADALAGERERFLRLSRSEEAAALRHIVFAERAAGKSLTEAGAVATDLSRVGVIGGGTMGAGIATALLLARAEVHLIERDDAAAKAAQARVSDTLSASVQRGAIAEVKADTALARLSTGDDYAALADFPLVIEAVFEDMAVKQQVFVQIDAVMPPDAVLASNTSYLDVNALAASTRDPSRILGMHLFAPAHVMKLLEAVRGDRTSTRAGDRRGPGATSGQDRGGGGSLRRLHRQSDHVGLPPRLRVHAG